MLNPDDFKNELMSPHRSYLPFLRVMEKVTKPKGYCHITGGGLEKNPPRILPEKLYVDWKCWEIPEVYSKIQELADLSTQELREMYNCGVGFLVIVNPEDAGIILDLFKLDEKDDPYKFIGSDVFEIGKIVASEN